jgi:transcription initiation factor TFIIB
LITDNYTGELLCGSCGQVLIEKIEDYGQENRTFTLEQFNEQTRTGAKSSLAIHDRGLATSVGNVDIDASGRSLSGYMKNTFNRLRVWDSRSKSEGIGKNFRHAFILLDTIKSQLAIPDSVVEETAYIYRKAISNKLTRGRGISSILYASLYAACRKTNTPRTLQDIAHAGNIKKGDLAQAYRILIRTLDLKFEPYDPVEFVTKIATVIGVSEKTRRDALNIILQAEEKKICAGKNPMALVATAIYLSSCINGEKKSQTDIAKASGVSNVTIRNLCTFFKPRLGLQYEKEAP